jgi:hypothetical protein
VSEWVDRVAQCRRGAGSTLVLATRQRAKALVYNELASVAVLGTSIAK